MQPQEFGMLDALPAEPASSDASAIERLRGAYAADPSAQDAAALIEDREAGLAAMVAQASVWGIAIGVDELRLALQPDPLGIERFSAAPVTGLNRPGSRWLPVGVSSDGVQAVVEWAHFGEAPLSEPFFEEPARRARNRLVSRLLRWRTPLIALPDDPSLAAAQAPDGLIFHMSRCGSTLVAQALAAAEHTIAISEPPPLDAVIQLCAAHPDLSLENRARLVRAMVAALTAARTGNGTGNGTGQAGYKFVKFDAWHTLALDLLLAAFPDTPWIMLYRDPVEVMLSHQQMPGLHSLPGPLTALLEIEAQHAVHGPDYTARALAIVCNAAATALVGDAERGLGMAVDYASLPGAIAERILPHFGLAPEEIAKVPLAEVAARDAKSPRQGFDPGKRSRRESAPPALLDAAARHLEPAVAALARLDRMRHTAETPGEPWPANLAK
jgi:hypothetical protein